MSVIEFLILGLATWRLSSLLVNEEGPWGLLARFRHLLGVRYDELSNVYGTNILARLLTCLWCTSVWIGAFLVVAFLLMPKVVLLMMPFALSGFAILFEEMICGHRS